MAGASIDLTGSAPYDDVAMAILVLDAPDRAVDANRTWVRLSGLDRAASSGRGWLAALAPEDRDLLRDELDRHGGRDGGRDVRSVDVRLRRGGERTRWTRWTWHGTTQPGRFVVSIVDIDEDRSRELELTDRAMRDQLTGVANRRQFLETLAGRIRDLDSTGGSVVVVFADLDGFKAINDRAGHLAGDLVLADVGRRLHRAMRPGDLVGRLGGDEFAVLCDGITGSTSNDALKERLMHTFDEPFDVLGIPWRLGATMGVASTDRGDTDPKLLVARADRSMYVAKRERRAAAAAPAAPIVADSALVLMARIDPGTLDAMVRRLHAVGLDLARSRRERGRERDHAPDLTEAIDALIRDLHRAGLAARADAG